MLCHYPATLLRIYLKGFEFRVNAVSTKRKPRRRQPGCVLFGAWLTVCTTGTPKAGQTRGSASFCRPRGCQSGWSRDFPPGAAGPARSEEHTSELQSHVNLVCRLLLAKKKLYT